MRSPSSSPQVVGTPSDGACSDPNPPVDSPTFDFNRHCSAFGLRRYAKFLVRNLWIPLLNLLIFGGLAAVYVTWCPPCFSSSAHMWAVGKIGLQLREGATYAEDNVNFAGTQIELLRSDLVRKRAFDRVQKILQVEFPTNSKGEPILPSVKVIQLPRSAVLTLKAKGRTEKIVIAFLNATMDEFLAYKREVRAATSGEAYTTVSEQTIKQEVVLRGEQERLTAYMRENNVAVLEEQAKAASAYLTQLLAEYSELKLQYQLIEANSVEDPWALTSLANASATATVARNFAAFGLLSANPPPEFIGAREELQKLIIMRLRLGEYLRPKHPKIIKLDEQIAQSHKLVDFFSRQSQEQLLNVKRTTKSRIDRIEETIKEWEARVNNASERIAEYERLKLSVNRLQELHDHLIALLQTVEVAKNLAQETVTILDRPLEAQNAKMPLLVTAFLLIAGLCAGFGMVFLVEQRDDRIMSLEELAGRFQECIVGQVPDMSRARKNASSKWITIDDHRHGFSESHCNIRSALWFGMDPKQKPRVILVTSAMPGEGKSTLAANLARTMAFAGAHVLLVDADLRRGILHQLFEVPAEPGLSDLLERNAGMAPSLIQTPVPNLALLARGKPSDNPGELLLSANCDGMLASLRNQFDCVVVDSAPVFASDDTTSLAPKVDGVLFVVRNSFTSASAAHDALQLLYARQTPILGLILNRVDPRSGSYRYCSRERDDRAKRRSCI